MSEIAQPQESLDSGAHEQIALALQQERDFNAALLDTAASLIVVLDSAGRVLRFNRACEQLSGVSRAEMEGRPFWDALDAPEMRRQLQQNYLQRRDIPLPTTFESYWPLRDGDRRLISWSVSALNDAEGRPEFIIATGIDITEARQREDALRESEEGFRSLFMHSLDAVLLTTPEGDILAANPEACRIFGRTEDEICRAGRPGLVDVSDPRLPGLLEERARTGKAQGELTFRRADGTTFPGELNSAIFLDRRGQPRTSMIIRDVTQRRLAEEALRLSEERFRNAFDEAAIGMALVAPDGRWLKVNRALCEIVGYRADELLATDVQAVTHPDDVAEDLRRTGQMLAGSGSTRQLEKRYIHKQGHVVWVWLSISLVRDSAGRPLYFLSQIQDITARKQAEAAQYLLVESGMVLSASLEYVPTLQNVARFMAGSLADYCVIDLREDDGRVRRVAGAHADPEREPLVQELVRYSPDAGTRSLVAGVMSTGEPLLLVDIADSLVAASSADVYHQRTVSALAPRSSMIVPLHTRAGTIGAITLVRSAPSLPYADADLRLAMDIARRAALALENATLYRQARDALASRDALLSVVSHDIKNHLLVVGAFATLLPDLVPHDDSPAARQLLEGLALVKGAATQMTNLVHDLMDFARLQAGRSLDLFAEPVDLVALAQEVIRQQQLTTQRHRIQLHAAVVPLVGTWDHDRLARMLGNLLSNAIKFSPRGGEILVSLDRARDADGDWAVLAVQDHGLGIPAADLPDIFTQFARARNVGDIKGTGVGLFSAQQIVKLHKGSIAVESTEGAGSTFTVRLPFGAG